MLATYSVDNANATEMSNICRVIERNTQMTGSWIPKCYWYQLHLPEIERDRKWKPSPLLGCRKKVYIYIHLWICRDVKKTWHGLSALVVKSCTDRYQRKIDYYHVRWLEDTRRSSPSHPNQGQQGPCVKINHKTACRRFEISNFARRSQN